MVHRPTRISVAPILTASDVLHAVVAFQRCERGPVLDERVVVAEGEPVVLRSAVQEAYGEEDGEQGAHQASVHVGFREVDHGHPRSIQKGRHLQRHAPYIRVLDQLLQLPDEEGPRQTGHRLHFHTFITERQW